MASSGFRDPGDRLPLRRYELRLLPVLSKDRRLLHYGFNKRTVTACLEGLTLPGRYWSNEVPLWNWLNRARSRLTPSRKVMTSQPSVVEVSRPADGRSNK